MGTHEKIFVESYWGWHTWTQVIDFCCYFSSKFSIRYELKHFHAHAFCILTFFRSILVWAIFHNRNGTLDLLMADSPILDYYRATDHGCSLQRIGETFVEDTYAIGMVKGFPLRESISALIAKYSSNGYLDILTEKWYGGLPCFKYESEIVTPRPLGKCIFFFW